ncbi:MAG TPA: ATP-binding protein [Anaerolineaceae bacterium]|nr:ATP-binding protein [Anaerolineaceae bacterium]
MIKNQGDSLSETQQNLVKDLELLQIAVASQNSLLKSDEIGLLILNGINRHLNIQSSVVFLIEEDQEPTLRARVITDGPNWSAQVTTSMQPGLVDNCFKTGQPVISNDIPSEPLFNPAIDALDNSSPRAIICYPLIANSQKLGVVELISKVPIKLRPFEENILNFFSQTLANAIYYNDLIQQLKIANADLEANRWELLRSRNTLRALFDGLPSSIYIINRQYQLVAINISRANRVRESPSMLVGNNCYTVLFNRNEPCPGCLIHETLLHGTNTNRTLREWISPDRPVDWDIATYPIKNELNNPFQVIIIEQDVTEKRRLEANLAQSEKLAAVGQLAAGVAHEINNPLSAIIANAQLLTRDNSLDVDQLDSVKLIEQAGMRASQVVRELLGFARKDQLSFEPTDLNETIHAALSILQHEILNRSVKINLDLADDLPFLNGNKDYLQGVWINLVLNAIDAINNNEGSITITSSFINNEYRVTVADSGVGIPPERITRIFEPFYTTKDPGRGTGLGLSMIHRTIKQHGGYITVDSQVGKGTIFTVFLPHDFRQSRNPSEPDT